MYPTECDRHHLIALHSAMLHNQSLIFPVNTAAFVENFKHHENMKKSENYNEVPYIKLQQIPYIKL